MIMAAGSRIAGADMRIAEPAPTLPYSAASTSGSGVNDDAKDQRALTWSSDSSPWPLVDSLCGWGESTGCSQLLLSILSRRRGPTYQLLDHLSFVLRLPT